MQTISRIIFRTALITFLFGPAAIYSQPISNTTWKTFNISFPDTILVEVGSDTIHQYLGSDSLLVSSLFWQYSDSIALLDVGGPLSCTNPDTGWYSIEIINDTMTVSLITDACVPRGMNYDGAILWKVEQATAVHKYLEGAGRLAIFPNPAGSSFSIDAGEEGSIIINDMTAGTVYGTKVKPGRNEITAMLPAGTYLVQFTGTGGNSGFARLMVK